MLQAMIDNWWAFVLRGVLAILFGLAAFAWPGLTAAVLMMFLGAWFLVDGVFGLIAAFRSEEDRMMGILLSAISMVAGLMVLVKPLAGMVAVTIVIGVWAIFKGVLEISAAIRLRKEMEDEWFFILAGVLSIIFGAVIILRPGVGLMAVVWILGFYAILFGILMVVLGFKLKGAKAPAAA